MPKKVNRISFFPNGVTAVFDENGEQISELQEPWLLKFFEFVQDSLVTNAALSGYTFDPKDSEIRLPDGKRAAVFDIPNGELNWRPL